MTLLIIMCGLDLLDWNINIPEYVTVPTVLIIFILVFAKIVYDFCVTKKIALNRAYPIDFQTSSSYQEFGNLRLEPPLES